MKAIVVVPTCRELSLRQFMQTWAVQFFPQPGREVAVYVVEDSPEQTFQVKGCEHFSHQDIERDLGKAAWIIPRHTDCVRSYGLWKAWQAGADLIVTLDDDVRPIDYTPGTFLGCHARALQEGVEMDAWTATITGIKPRGMPYHRRTRRWPVTLNHGLWVGNVDVDAVTALATTRYAVEWPGQAIQPGQYFPMCGMNLAFRPDLVPALYFGLQGPAWPFDRFGDIWAGLFVKRICDHLGLAVCSGQPHVRHDQASDVWVNLRKEGPGLVVNEWLWERVDAVRLHGATVGECYVELADRLALWLKSDDAYWGKLGEAMHIWASLFE